MTAATARLDFPLTTVDEHLYLRDEEEELQLRERVNFARHAYLHALIYGERGFDQTTWQRERETERRRTIQKTEGLFVAVPQPGLAAAPRIKRKPVRSLSEPYAEVKRMAAVVEEEVAPEIVPSSPPDLSYSKSSDSSDSSDEEEKARFENVSIDGRDSIEDRNLRPESRPTLKRPAPRSAATIDASGRMVSPPLSSKENRFPSLRGQVNGVLRDQSLNLPHGRAMRRGLSTPSAPNLMMHSSPKMSADSRSPSPTKPFMQNGVSVSPQTLASATPRLSGDARSPGLSSGTGQFVRRQSWQPGRKSVKELEAECDDGDEEVPDDAVLENIPISPMPGQLRASPRVSPRPSRSATPSPQRRPSHTNLHSANVPKNAKRPSAPKVLPNGQIGMPRSPRHGNGKMPMLTHSKTMPLFIGEALSRRHRSKSWTEDLNDTTAELSDRLQEMAERASMEKHGIESGTNSVASSPPRPSLSKQRAKTTIMDLPTVETGRIMIDPLPISKEKEAVLTKTRPSWLPPKDPKEDQKHMKEWSQMMARAMEIEKKRRLREREAREDQEELKDSIERLWDQHVLPNWDVVIQEPRTRELWWRGVTPRSRGVVWQKAIGNELELDEASFDAALKRAAELEEKIAEMSDEERADSNESAWFDAIERDIRTACPEMKDPAQRGPFQNDLRDVLRAYAMYRSDVGYVYGTHLVAGILCLHLRPVDAFVALANLLNGSLPLAFLVNDTAAMSRAYDLVLSTLKYKFTHLHDHLTNPATGLKPEEYLDPMFRCLFAFHLPTELVARIWDIFVFEGDKVLIRTVVAVLGRLERRLYGTREEILDVVSWRNEKHWDLGPAEDFIKAVREAGKVDAKGDAER